MFQRDEKKKKHSESWIGERQNTQEWKTNSKKTTGRQVVWGEKSM